MNENLGIIKEFPGTSDLYQSACGNATYLAHGDNTGSVRYYKRDFDVEPKVILLSFQYCSKVIQVYNHDEEAGDIRVYLKNNLVISGSDTKVLAWNMERHEKLWESAQEDSVWYILLRDDQVITCCEDKSVRVLALQSGEELHRLEHPSPCNGADLSPNKKILAVACDSAVVLWDFKKAVKIEQFDLGTEDSQVNDVRFNPTGDKLIAGLSEGEVFVIELKQNNLNFIK